MSFPITEPRGCPTPGACSCPTAPFVPPELIRAQELTEAALAVREAAEKQTDLDFRFAPAIAEAVLQAVADQVVPEQKPWHRTDGEPAARHKVRLEILAIAAELMAQ